jgi:hypothetical protein
MEQTVTHVENDFNQQIKEMISVLAEICVHEVLNRYGRKDISHEISTNSKAD